MQMLAADAMVAVYADMAAVDTAADALDAAELLGADVDKPPGRRSKRMTGRLRIEGGEPAQSKPPQDAPTLERARPRCHERAGPLMRCRLSPSTSGDRLLREALGSGRVLACGREVPQPLPPSAAPAVCRLCGWRRRRRGPHLRPCQPFIVTRRARPWTVIRHAFEC
jgi:hypothetical protein